MNSCILEKQLPMVELGLLTLTTVTLFLHYCLQGVTGIVGARETALFPIGYGAKSLGGNPGWPEC